MSRFRRLPELAIAQHLYGAERRLAMTGQTERIRCASLERRVTALLEELDEQRRQHDLEVREFQRERLAYEAEAEELVEQLAAFMDFVS